jgi:response regulator of citrate/malate metabolism
VNTRTLVVEDDPVLAEAHASYVERVPGFVVAGIVHRGTEAVETVCRGGVDLVLLDFFLPDIGGLSVCRALRARGQNVDVIAVTSERRLAVVQAAIAVGVVHYVLKPFTFATFAERLNRYAEYRRVITGTGGTAAQHDVDRAYAMLRTPIRPHLPKGLSTDTLSTLIDALHGCDGPLTAAETAEATGTSRVTARRYLEYLTAHRMAIRTLRYGTKGRPEHEYRWNRAVG